MTALTQDPGVKATTTMHGDREIHIERVFNAPRERVWRAMTEPKLLAQWWGRGNKLDIERLELRRGGHWRFVEQTPHGPQGFEGRYRDVKPPERMSLTFEWDGAPGHVAINTLTLEDMGDGRTKLLGTLQFFTTEDRDGMVHSGMEQGMNESYAALDRVLVAMADHSPEA
jgi:uncharacterized protein YndB with AHSA1/START domain